MLDKENTGDVNSLEDRLWALANTVSIEEHAVSSYLRTRDERFLEAAYKFRDIRRTHMQRILGDDDAHTCVELLLGLIGIAQDSPEQELYKDVPRNTKEQVSEKPVAAETEDIKEHPENQGTGSKRMDIKESDVKEDRPGFFGRLKTALLSCCRE